MFSKDQLDRYARHIILPGVGAAGQKRLLKSKVLVIGAGGLGSPILLYLAAAGVGTLGIVDDDVVDLSNLQRQVIHTSKRLGEKKTDSARASISDLNSDINVVSHEVRLDSSNSLDILQDYDLILDGSDNFPTRYLVNDACVLLGKPLVYGAMSQFEGQVSLLHAETESGLGPCYRCLYPEPPQPGVVRSCAEAGVFGALPGVIGSLMATEAVKHLVGLGETLAGTLLHFDALYSEFRRVRLVRNAACAVCGDAPSIRELVDYEVFCGV